MIEQGAQVKEGQKMLRIPNLTRMQVNTKVHEAMVSRIRGEVRVPTRIVETTQAAMLFTPNHFGRLVLARPEAVEKIRDEYRERAQAQGGVSLEYKKVADGQKAIVKLDSMGDKQFLGQVKTVATVASQTDSWISDVKVYQTYVRIEGELAPDGKTVTPLTGERLKPDMSAEVTISVDSADGPVLTIPIQAVIGGAEMGATREVFVKTGGKFERKPVKLGLFNETMVEIKEGVQEGDQVVVNPKVLFEEGEKTRTREPGDLKGDQRKGEKGGFGGPGGGPGGAGGPGGNEGGGAGGGPGGAGGGKKGGFGGKKGGGGAGGGGFQKGGGAGGPPPVGG
jgi:multidrug efflux pump subunit AcrA (membrane-fusion protein)